MSGAENILSERVRQWRDERWTDAHDDRYVNGELVRAAMCYAEAAHTGLVRLDASKFHKNPPDQWPWDWKWWKPSNDPQRNLEKAGALLAAEHDRIARMKRQQAKGTPPPGPDILSNRR